MHRSYLHRVFLISVFCVLVTFDQPFAQIFVKADATGSNNGSSWTDAYADLQDALAVATSGDEIWVARGTYKPTSTANRSISFVLPPGTATYGGFAGNEFAISERNIADNPTILSGNIGAANSSDNSYHVVIASRNITLDGFTIMGGNADGGNFDDQGGGVHALSTSGLTLANLTFIDNYSFSIGGGLLLGGATLTNVVFIDNTSNRGGGIFLSFSGSATITNAVFIGNVGFIDGGGIHQGESGSLIITNATFTGNGSAYGPAIANIRSTVVLTNLIMIDHTIPAVESRFLDGAVTTIGHSLIDGSGGSGASWDANLGTDGGNNIDTDPQLLDLLGNDVRLQRTSPARDAGDNAAPSLPPTDLAGNPRIVGANVDMGAYEFVCAAGSRIWVDADAPAAGDGSSWLTAYRSLTHAFAAACNNVTEIWVAEGTYTPSAANGREVTFKLRNNLAIYGGFHGTETTLAQRDFLLHPTVLSGNLTDGTHSFHVVTTSGTDATAVLDGFTIAGGSADTKGGGLLNVGGSPTIANVIFDSNAAAGGGGGMAISSGAPTLSNVQFVGNTASNGDGGGLHNLGSPVLDDVTFSGNSALALGGGMYNGGGIPVMTNIFFDTNSASGGGGLYNNATSPTITNGIFRDNTATNGGGIYNFLNSNTVLTNVIFTGNHALIGSGGAMYNAASDPVITNNTFNNNAAPNQGGGAIYNSASDPMLTNTVLWGNTAATGDQIQNFGSTPVIAYSLVENSGGSGGGWDPTLGTDGGHNVDADPLFADAPSGDVHLTAGSPAIDAGDNGAPNLAPIDLDGNPRIAGVAVDMGAYEFDAATAVPKTGVSPGETGIRSVAPNPFNPVVTVQIEIGSPRRVRLAVYDVRGALVRELLNEFLDAGIHSVTWNATDDRGSSVASGAYFLRLESHGMLSHRKLILLK